MLPVKPFNGVFWMILALTIVAVAAIRRNFAGQPYARKTRFLTCLCACNIVVFFVYKFMLSIDAEFPMLAGIDRFNWFNELPLQLCNINLFLIPLGVRRKSRPVLGFSFFTAPLGALMALLFPESSFIGYSIFTPRILGFYLTHSLLIICGLSLSALDLYRPRWQDIPGILRTLGVLALGAHIVNTALRHTVCAYANYFFTYRTDISILNLFWKLIPVPLLYLLPGLLILLPYMCIIIAGGSLMDRRTAQPVEDEEAEEEKITQSS